MGFGGQSSTMTQEVDPDFKNRQLGLFDLAQGWANDTNNPYQTPGAMYGPNVAGGVLGADPWQQAASSFMAQQFGMPNPGFSQPEFGGPQTGPQYDYGDNYGMNYGANLGDPNLPPFDGENPVSQWNPYPRPDGLDENRNLPDPSGGGTQYQPGTGGTTGSTPDVRRRAQGMTQANPNEPVGAVAPGFVQDAPPVVGDSTVIDRYQRPDYGPPRPPTPDDNLPPIPNRYRPGQPQGAGTMPGSMQALDAAATAQNLTGFQPQQVAAQNAQPYANAQAQNVQAQLGAGGMSAYQNPWETQVVNQGIDDLARANAIAQQYNRSGSSGTYGGDRQAIIESEQNRNFLDRAGALSSNLRSEGFNVAAQNAQQDAQRMLGAGGMNQNANLTTSLANQGVMNNMGQFNSSLGLQGQMANQQAQLGAGGLRLGAANSLNQFGNDQLNNTLGATNAMYNLGAGGRQIGQAQLSGDLAEYQNAQNDPLMRMQAMQSMLTGMPVGMSSTTSQGGNPWAGILGLAGTLGGGYLAGR